MHKNWFFFFVACWVLLPWHGQAHEYWTNQQTRNLLGPCPSYINGIEVGYAFAIPYGTIQLVDINTQEKNRAYTQDLAVTLRMVNRNFFDDRLKSVSTKIANTAVMRSVRYAGKGSKYDYSTDEIIVPGAKPPVSDAITTDEEFLKMVELRTNNLFIHVQDVQEKIYFGDLIPIQLSFANAGTGTVYVSLLSKKDFDSIFQGSQTPWQSCG